MDLSDNDDFMPMRPRPHQLSRTGKKTKVSRPAVPSARLDFDDDDFEPRRAPRKPAAKKLEKVTSSLEFSALLLGLLLTPVPFHAVLFNIYTHLDRSNESPFAPRASFKRHNHLAPSTPSQSLSSTLNCGKRSYFVELRAALHQRSRAPTRHHHSAWSQSRRPYR